MELDLTALERELCRLPEVNAARIVADDIGRPVEIHILAGSGKHAKQVARDIQSVAMASFGLELDRRIISVVQLDTGEGGEEGRVGGGLGSAGRIVIGGITSEQHGLRCLVRVTLERDDEEVTGFAEGSVATSTRHRVVAHATLDALRQLLPSAEGAEVETATVTHLGLREVAVATVVFVNPPHEEVMSGSAVVRGNEAEAVTRAVLDATNRRLPQLH